MGGWRCTYRNCSVAADRKTHLFHYPVFDKVRCLKWLTNAGKLEFLDLKLSQLKNRVICEHHFKDDCFMNYKRDKLTFAAIPTENGSFSDTTIVKLDDEKINLPITLEDIENSEIRALTPGEKKANYSVKYGDFLTDPILDDFTNFNVWSDKTYISRNTQETTQFSVSQPLFSSDNVDKGISFNISENIDKGISFNVDMGPTPEVLQILEATSNTFDKSNSNKLLNYDILSRSQINPNVNTGEVSPEKKISSKNDILSRSQVNPNDKTDGEILENKFIDKNKNKIKILSEKTLTAPLPVVGTFKPVCPTGILNPRKRKVEAELRNKQRSLISTVKEEPQIPEKQSLDHPIEHMSPSKPNLLPGEAQNELKIISSPTEKQRENMLSNSRSPSTRKKIPPERVAAIEEKRTFNKKLRDMIEFCLDDKEENTKKPVKVKSPQTSQSEYASKNSQLLKNTPLHKESQKCTKISEHLKKGVNAEQEVKSTVNENEVIKGSQDYKLTVLEAKLSKMENLLLKKVGENTQRIDSLKQVLAQKSKDVKKRSIQTQTCPDKEMHKKELFSEISRYLSPELNSLIYEELFIQEFDPEVPYSNVSKNKVENISPIKRPRRRY